MQSKFVKHAFYLISKILQTACKKAMPMHAVGRQAAYSASQLARLHVVAVSANYRSSGSAGTNSCMRSGGKPRIPLRSSHVCTWSLSPLIVAPPALQVPYGRQDASSKNRPSGSAGTNSLYRSSHVYTWSESPLSTEKLM